MTMILLLLYNLKYGSPRYFREVHGRHNLTTERTALQIRRSPRGVDCLTPSATVVRHPDSTNRPGGRRGHGAGAERCRRLAAGAARTFSPSRAPTFNERSTSAPFPRISIPPPLLHRSLAPGGPTRGRLAGRPAARPPEAGRHDAGLLAVRFRRATPVRPRARAAAGYSSSASYRVLHSSRSPRCQMPCRPLFHEQRAGSGVRLP